MSNGMRFSLKTALTNRLIAVEALKPTLLHSRKKFKKVLTS